MNNIEHSLPTDSRAESRSLLPRLAATGISALSLSPSCIAWQQPACVRGHRDPLWGEQWQRRPRLQRQVQKMGSAQLPRKETQSNLWPGMKDIPCRGTLAVPAYAALCVTEKGPEHGDLFFASNQSCFLCT